MYTPYPADASECAHSTSRRKSIATGCSIRCKKVRDPDDESDFSCYELPRKVSDV